MSIVSFSDYCFSFKRGAFLENIKTLFLYVVKSLILNLYAFKFSCKRKFSLHTSDIHKVAIYIPSSAGMGDLVMSQMFFRELRMKLPNAKIVLYSRFHQLVQKKFIDRVENILSLKLKEQLKILNQENFDLICFPEKSFNGASLFVSVNCKYKVGYLNSYQVKSNFSQNEKIFFMPHKDHYFLKSYSLYFCLFGKNSEIPKYIPDLSEWQSSKSNIEKNYIVIIPKVQWENRSVSFDTLILIIEGILKSSFNVYLAGGEESKLANEKLFAFFEKYKDRISYKPSMSLDEFSGVIRESSGIICGDSGPMHLAYGFQKPVLSFWGPTFPYLRVPEGENQKSISVFEKEKCKVECCYNMEFKPFCNTCLRLESISNVSETTQKFLNNL